ncbi:hypothetical protein [Mycolicibacterium sediminis]|nr:hypothetical protein [Mycolicibacterium sediminis]
MTHIWRWTTAAMVAMAVGSAGIGLGASAQAQPGPSYQGGNCPPGLTCTHWCPGDPLLPGHQVVSWDWGVCHDWYWNSYGVVDVVANVINPWRGAPQQAPPPPTFGGPSIG